jgi:hypothetical protein
MEQSSTSRSDSRLLCIKSKTPAVQWPSVFHCGLMAGPHRHRSINAPTGFFCFPEERKRNVILCCPNGNDYTKWVSNSSSLRNAHIVTPVSKYLVAGKWLCEFCSAILVDNMETVCSEDFTALLVKFTALFVIYRRFSRIWCLCL